MQRHLEEQQLHKDEDEAVNEADGADHKPSSYLKEIDDDRNAGRYVSESKQSTSYGFGVDHSYPYMSPRYKCMRAELTRNTMHRLAEFQFQNILVKAIKVHQIAIDKQLNYQLYCKYFDPQFNVARNEPIGIRHILAVVTYTDLSDFCTVYRQTYRLMPGETSETQVAERHRELYYYARALFECIEFFGEWMAPNAKVLHGLDTVMVFQRFTTYFNQVCVSR